MLESGSRESITFNGGKLATDRHEFNNDLEIFCSAKEHEGMVLELIRVYGISRTLKEVLDDINYQLDKYKNLMFSHHLDDVKSRLTGAIASTINDIKERNYIFSIDKYCPCRQVGMAPLS